MKYDIFLVDADNTLLDFHASSLLALREGFIGCGITWQEEYGESFTRFNDWLWERLERKEITRAELLATRFPLFLEKLGIKGASGEKFNDIYLRELALRPVYMTGATAFLTRLKAFGSVYVVTNGTTKIQKSRFSICKLYDYVDGVFISEEIGFDKPSRGFTDCVISHIPDFQREKAVWIGDSLSADIQAANEAYICSVWLNGKHETPKNGVKPDFIACDYQKILDFLGITSV